MVEAVFENMELKKKVLAELDGIVRPDAILATNTSTLSITELSSVTKHTAPRLVGLHFFVPANVMRLLEIVRGASTSPQAIVTGLDVAKKLRKVGVVVGDGFGFVGNRMMLDGYFRETEQLMLEGATPGTDRPGGRGLRLRHGPQQGQRHGLCRCRHPAPARNC